MKHAAAPVLAILFVLCPRINKVGYVGQVSGFLAGALRRIY